MEQKKRRRISSMNASGQPVKVASHINDEKDSLNFH
jgi:hypothetical protein